MFFTIWEIAANSGYCDVPQRSEGMDVVAKLCSVNFICTPTKSYISSNAYIHTINVQFYL